MTKPDLAAIPGQIQATESALAIERDTASAALEYLKAQSVNTPETYAWAEQSVKRVKERLNELTAEQKKLTGPLQDVIRGIQALFRPSVTHFAECESLLKSKMATYLREQEAERQTEMAALIPIQAPVTPGAGVSIRKVRKWRIVSEDSVPRNWCSPDPKKIQAHFDAGGLEAIAGVEFYDEDIVSVRVDR